MRRQTGCSPRPAKRKRPDTRIHERPQPEGERSDPYDFEILDKLDDGFLVVDEHQRFTYINSRAKRLLGADVKSLIGKAMWEIFPQLVGSELFLHMRRVAEQQQRRSFVTQLVYGNWTEVRVYPCCKGLCVHFRLISVAQNNQVIHSKRAMCQEIVAAREEERQRIARELHDGTGQLLAALAIGARMLEDARTLNEAQQRGAALRNIADRIYKEIGHVVHRLHPAAVEQMGLATALQELVLAFSKTFGIPVDMDTNGVESLQLASGAQIGLYRIVQEALTNVSTHAKATRVRIAFKFTAPRLELTVKDNGQGFTTKDIKREDKIHLGLRTMRERAEILGGNLWVESNEGNGTIVRANIPVASA